MTLFEPFTERPAVPARLRGVLGRRRVLRARDGPSPAGLRRRARRRSEPVRRHPEAVDRSDPVRLRPDQDVQGRPGRADARGHLLGLRAPDHRHRQHRDRRAHPDDRVDPVRRPPVGARQRDAERRGGRRPGGHRLGIPAPARHEAKAPDLQPRRADHPLDDRWRRGHRTAGADLRGGRLWRHRRRVHLECPRRTGPGDLQPGPDRDPVRRLLVGPHRAGGGIPRLPAVQQAPPHRHELPEHLVPQARPARGAPEARPRGRRRVVRVADAPGPRLEGPARRVHVHRVRSLPGGVSGLEHRQAAQSQALHHGHPRAVRGRGARDRHHPELADRARDLWARGPPSRRGGDGHQDRGHGDPVRRGLGLRDMWRLRRGLPGAHRARGQDRRPAPEPRPRGIHGSRRS